MLKQFCFSNCFKVSCVYSDIASGISFEKRKDFFQLLDDVTAGRVEKVVITYKDRLSCVGLDLFYYLFQKYNREIIVMSGTGSQKLDSEEIFEEIIALLHCYSMKLYSNANYEIRQAFIKEGKRLRYEEINRILKADKGYPDYAAMPAAQSAQQTLRILDRNWKSWSASLRDWRLHKDKYRGKPRMPGYLKKDEAFQPTLTNQNCRLEKGMLCFPGSFAGSQSPLLSQRGKTSAPSSRPA